MKLLAFVCGALLLPAMSLHGQATDVLGDWREPSGSVIRVAPCGEALCATLVVISASAPVAVDGYNPDTSLRNRPLCGLRIGRDFRTTSPDKAEDGKLYDPKTGKTYKGTMTSEGNVLLLRGYIGISVFGRTEKWNRVTTPVEACKADGAASAKKPAA